MMKYRWDAAGVDSRTDRTKLRIKVQEEWLKQVKRDPRIAERKQRQECVVCFYTQRICGQGFTRYNCGMCEVEINWPNTCVPILCEGCARKNSLCMKCGGDL